MTRLCPHCCEYHIPGDSADDFDNVRYYKDELVRAKGYIADLEATEDKLQARIDDLFSRYEDVVNQLATYPVNQIKAEGIREYADHYWTNFQVALDTSYADELREGNGDD